MVGNEMSHPELACTLYKVLQLEPTAILQFHRRVGVHAVAVVMHQLLHSVRDFALLKHECFIAGITYPSAASPRLPYRTPDASYASSTDERAIYPSSTDLGHQQPNNTK